MNIIFDIGNVLVSYEPLAYLRNMFPDMDNNLTNSLFFGIFQSPEWALMDQGLLTQQEACTIFCQRRPEHQQEIRQAMAHLDDIFTPKTATVNLLPRIKKAGHSLYYLSNIHRETRDFLLRAHGYFNLFDGGVFSCDVNINKPAPGIYRALLQKYGLSPQDCVFFDDVEANVAAARAEGINAVCFTNAECVEPYI